MIINNKKIDFLFTVGAEADMRKLCEGGNIEAVSYTHLRAHETS